MRRACILKEKKKFVDYSPMALDIANTPSTLGRSQYITRPPAAWIRSNSSGRSGCSKPKTEPKKLVHMTTQTNQLFILHYPLVEPPQSTQIIRACQERANHINSDPKPINKRNKKTLNYYYYLVIVGEWDGYLVATKHGA